MSKKSFFIIGTILGVILIYRFYQFYHSHPSYHDGQHVSLTTTLQAEPTMGSGGQKFTIRTLTNQLISVTADASPSYHYGQVLTMDGELQSYTFPDGTTILRLYHPQIVLEKQSDNVV